MTLASLTCMYACDPAFDALQQNTGCNKYIYFTTVIFSVIQLLVATCNYITKNNNMKLLWLLSLIMYSMINRLSSNYYCINTLQADKTTTQCVKSLTRTKTNKIAFLGMQ